MSLALLNKFCGYSFNVNARKCIRESSADTLLFLGDVKIFRLWHFTICLISGGGAGGGAVDNQCVAAATRSFREDVAFSFSKRRFLGHCEPFDESQKGGMKDGMKNVKKKDFLSVSGIRYLIPFLRIQTGG